jgi:hypothetical protein
MAYDIQVSDTEVKLDNITIKISSKNPQWEEYLGESTYSIDAKYVRDYVLGLGDFKLPYLDNEEDSLKDFNIFDGDDTLHHHSIDGFIAMVGFFYDNDSELVIEVETVHVFWVVHDILHAIHDYHGQYIQISDYAEKLRHLEAFRLCFEAGCIDPSDYGLFASICEESQRSRRLEGRLEMYEFLQEIEVTSEFADWDYENYSHLLEDEEDYERDDIEDYSSTSSSEPSWDISPRTLWSNLLYTENRRGAAKFRKYTDRAIGLFRGTRTSGSVKTSGGFKRPIGGENKIGRYLFVLSQADC